MDRNFQRRIHNRTEVRVEMKGLNWKCSTCGETVEVVAVDLSQWQIFKVGCKTRRYCYKERRITIQEIVKK